MRKLYPLSVSCEVLEVSASGYFNWQRQPGDGHGSRSPGRRHSDEALLAHICAIHAESRVGRVVVRRGYGNQTTLANRWQEALVRLAFTPCLQYQYASGKNTADIALALDAMEALFDRRADTFCLVTSDSDFAYLCRKLRERGATVCIEGEPKTPDALRNASDQFFEWLSPEPSPEIAAELDAGKGNGKVAAIAKPDASKPEPAKAAIKQRPRLVVQAVSLLASDTSEGKVSLGGLGQYLKRTDAAFSPKLYGHSGLLDMIRTYDLLVLHQEPGGHWNVSLAPRSEAQDAKPADTSVG